MRLKLGVCMGRIVAEVGDIWCFVYNKGMSYEYSEYHLILRAYPDRYHGTLYQTYCISEGTMVPDLIIDAVSIRDYDAHQVA